MLPERPGESWLSQVFISYARTSEPQARRIDDALVAAGYAVWRDDQLPAHRAYADVIDERLRAAKAVLVLWSRDGARSQWVRAEADLARTQDKLVQADIFEPATAPLRRDPRIWPFAVKSGLAAYWRAKGVWPDFCADPALAYDCRTVAAKMVGG